MTDFHKLSVEDKLSQVYIELINVKEALKGDEYGNKGMVKRLDILEADNRKRKEQSIYQKGMVVAFIAVWTILVKYGDKILELVKK